MKISQTLQAALIKNPVVPVLTIKEVKDAIPLARSLVKAGYTALEITLRTNSALAAITAIKQKFPNLQVGAGTIICEADMEKALAVGSDFIVTPATPNRLAKILLKSTTPVFPGCSTATEAQTLYELGFTTLKFFPAEASGGISALKSIAAPLPHLKFMPSGGITVETAQGYLSLPNVNAVGGSWMSK